MIENNVDGGNPATFLSFSKGKDENDTSNMVKHNG